MSTTIIPVVKRSIEFGDDVTAHEVVERWFKVEVGGVLVATFASEVDAKAWADGRHGLEADPEPEDSFPELYAAHGFEKWNTGGGCMAWGRQLKSPSGAEVGHILVTASDDPSLPCSLDDKASAGIYVGEESSPATCFTVPNTEEAVRALLLTLDHIESVYEPTMGYVNMAPRV